MWFGRRPQAVGAALTAKTAMYCSTVHTVHVCIGDCIMYCTVVVHNTIIIIIKNDDLW